DLHDPAAEPGGLREQAWQLPCFLLGCRLPRAARHLWVLLDVLAPGVGQGEHPPADRFRPLDQALVAQLRQRRIDRTRARPPGAAAALLDLRHNRVAVARPFAQQSQDRCPHVTAPGLHAARRPWRLRRTRPPATPWPAYAAAPVPWPAPAGELPVPGRA